MSGFMRPDVYKGEYYMVAADHGATYIVPVDVAGIVNTQGALQDYVEGKIDDPEADVEIQQGWLARLSAPGYLDCTDWNVYDTEQEAIAGLKELYGSDDDDEDEG